MKAERALTRRKRHDRFIRRGFPEQRTLHAGNVILDFIDAELGAGGDEISHVDLGDSCFAGAIREAGQLYNDVARTIMENASGYGIGHV